jgi:outer membrane protein assembly factor BamA
MKKYFVKFIIMLLATTGIANNILSQNIQLQLRGTEAQTFIEKSNLQTQYQSAVQCNNALQIALQKLLENGYLSASIDSLQIDSSKLLAHVQLGKIYTWARLQNKNIPISFLNQLHIEEKNFFEKKIEPQKLMPLYEKVLHYFEDNGYPFASLKLDSIIIQDGQLSALLCMQKGPLIKIDSIIINEDAKISRQFLLNYLGLKDDMLYSESKIKTISARLREIPFLTEVYPWKMYFTAGESTLKIYVKNKAANRADVLIGLLPNNAETKGKFLLTGDVKLGFMNALGKGEKFQLNWQNLQAQSPRYNLDASYPYLFNSPFGIQLKFDFYKKDSLFKTVGSELGLVYQFNANNHLKAFYALSSNRLGTVNIASLITTKRLPDNGDVTYKTFGFEGMLNHLDYKLNPRKGLRLHGKVDFSLRKIIKNTNIEQALDPIRNTRFTYLYDSVKLNTSKYNLTIEADYFIPLSKRVVLANKYYGGYMLSSQALYRNELYQLGGYRLMRGFDEGSLYANQYHVVTIEPRLLLSMNSYFFIFADAGYMQSKFINQSSDNKLYSAGLGMTFETKAGLFNLSYAVGADKNRSFEFKNSKIHFGYISIF